MLCNDHVAALSYPIESIQLVDLTDGVNTRGEVSWILWSLVAWPAILLCWVTGSTLLKLSRDRIVHAEPEVWRVAMAAAQGSGTENQDCAGEPCWGPYANCCCLASRLLKAFVRVAAPRPPQASPMVAMAASRRRASYSVLGTLPNAFVATAAGGEDIEEPGDGEGAAAAAHLEMSPV